MCREGRGPFVFYWQNFLPKKKEKKLKLELKNEKILKGFLWRESEENLLKLAIYIFSMFSFSVCGHKYESLIIQVCTSYLVYSQIWLNLPSDNCHFFYPHLCMDDCHLSYTIKKIPFIYF